MFNLEGLIRPEALACAISVFSYFDQPSVVFSKEDQIGFHGRSA